MFGEESDGLGIGNDVGKGKSEKITEGESVSNLSFGFFVGEVVQAFQYEYFEHEYGVEGFSTSKNEGGR